MNRKLAVRVAFAVWITLASGAWLRSASGAELAVVVPARERVVKLGFDVAALRHAVLIAYQVNPVDGQPVLHMWDEKAKAWQPLSLDAYAFGQFFNKGAGCIYLIGSDAELPATLVTGAEQLGGTVYRIETLDVANALNKLNETLKFSWREWRALSERHGLQVEDKNWARRKWGRYGPPKRKVEPSPHVPPTVPAAEGETETASEPGVEVVSPTAHAASTPTPDMSGGAGAVSPAAKVSAPDGPAVEPVSPPPRARVAEAPLPRADIEPAEAETEMEPPPDEK